MAERETERECVYVCVYLWERECVCVCVCVWQCVSGREKVSVARAPGAEPYNGW